MRPIAALTIIPQHSTYCRKRVRSSSRRWVSRLQNMGFVFPKRLNAWLAVSSQTKFDLRDEAEDEDEENYPDPRQVSINYLDYFYIQYFSKYPRHTGCTERTITTLYKVGKVGKVGTYIYPDIVKRAGLRTFHGYTDVWPRQISPPSIPIYLPYPPLSTCYARTR